MSAALLTSSFKAGIAHCSIDSDGDYEYIGLYPGVSGATALLLLHHSDFNVLGQQDKLASGLRFDIHWCKDTPERTKELAKAAAEVPIPECDPLYGRDGPLPKIWREASGGTSL